MDILGLPQVVSVSTAICINWFSFRNLPFLGATKLRGKNLSFFQVARALIPQLSWWINIPYSCLLVCMHLLPPYECATVQLGNHRVVGKQVVALCRVGPVVSHPPSYQSDLWNPPRITNQSSQDCYFFDVSSSNISNGFWLMWETVLTWKTEIWTLEGPPIIWMLART